MIQDALSGNILPNKEKGAVTKFGNVISVTRTLIVHSHLLKLGEGSGPCMKVRNVNLSKMHKLDYDAKVRL